MPSSAPECRLPELPAPLPPAIGFPAPDGQGIYLSKSDWALLIDHELGMRHWMSAAAACLEAR